MAIRERNLQCGIAGNHAKAMIGEMQVADHFGTKHAGNGRSCRSTATRRDLFRDAASANNVATFKNDGRVSSARQIRGGGESVVTSPDDDSVVRRILDG